MARPRTVATDYIMKPGVLSWINSGINQNADGITKKRDANWFSKLLNMFQDDQAYGASDSEIGKWFRDNYSSKFNDNTNALKYLESMNDSDLGALISNNYYKQNKSDMFGNEMVLDVDSLVQDLENLRNIQTGPRLEDYLGDYYGDAERQINAENADILKMYDDNLARQTNNFNNELGNLNNNYNDYVRQVLSNDYQKNASILGTYQSDMSKARQNALEAGANAGLRIAGNINTLLSTQNKQASTSLETSNQLAQAMLNQRNAAASLRGQYNSMLDTDTANRANLRRGTYERTQNAANLNYNNRMNQYNVANQIATENNGNYTESPFYDSYMKQGKANKW